jgi:hypothetical protein
VNLWQLLTTDCASPLDLILVAISLVAGYWFARNAQEKPLVSDHGKPKLPKNTGEAVFKDYIEDAFDLDSKDGDVPTIRQ